MLMIMLMYRTMMTMTVMNNLLMMMMNYWWWWWWWWWQWSLNHDCWAVVRKSCAPRKPKMVVTSKFVILKWGNVLGGGVSTPVPRTVRDIPDSSGKGANGVFGEGRFANLNLPSPNVLPTPLPGLSGTSPTVLGTGSDPFPWDRGWRQTKTN